MVFITHCLEGITGFGCTVLALPFVVLLLGIKIAVPVLVILAWLLAGYIIIRSWKNIIWKEFLFIVLYVGIGLPIGLAMFEHLSPTILKIILAIFMIGVGIHGIIKTRAQKKILLEDPTKLPVPKKNLIMKGILILGGIIHGAFGTGGPFVVIYASKALQNKTLFRVTLCLLWFSLNTIMLAQWFFTGNILKKEIFYYTLYTLPFLITGMLLGDYLHHKVNEYYFKILVYIILFASGIVLGAKLLHLF